MKSLALLFFSLFLPISTQAEMKPVTLEQNGNNVIVKISGKLFTEYVQGDNKPYLYPVIGPTGVNMTRNFPMKKGVKGESKDHPHHSSIYFTHGSVNGKDFWNDKRPEQKKCCILLDEIEKVENISPTHGIVIATHKWQYEDHIFLTDRSEIVFSGDEQKHIIDYKITLIASHGDVVLGDTKEGVMAIRMHHKLRVKDQNAKVINSEGIKGKGVWGKKARWVSYYNEIEGQVLGITMMDHPSNLRYPTHWHARDYGLCAANAFGIHYFEKKEKGTEKGAGDFILKAGESLTLSYRLLFHKGTPDEIKVDALHKEWIQK